MKREVLKSLALKAKNRMIHKGVEKDYGLDIYGDDSVSIKIIDSNDDIFYNKVRSLLESDEDIVNPIKKLMDETLLLKLDPRSKEKYLLETVEKYHKFRKLISDENTKQYVL